MKFQKGGRDRVARALVPARSIRSTPTSGHVIGADRVGPNPAGRLDIAAFRVVSEHLLPACEGILGIPGLAQTLRPHAENLIAETIPPVNVFKAPKPRRRLG